MRASLLLPLLFVAAGCFETRAPLEQGRETSAAECRDGRDNDGDGRFDCNDSDCRVWSFCYQVDGGVRDLAPRFDGQPCNCDDGLTCTEDRCLNNGSCFFVPRRGYCVIDGACWRDGAKNPKDPCRVCDAVRGPNSWLGANGGLCDDGDPCTTNDSCVFGNCRGTRYSCDDSLSCTDDACLGDGRCENKVRPGKCLINRACSDAGTTRQSSCDVCDPARDPRSWTPRTGCIDAAGSCVELGKSSADGCTRCELSGGQPTLVPQGSGCIIDGKCVLANARLGSCGICDPSKSTSGWTVLPGTCLIDGSCFASGGGLAPCARCNPQQSSTQWTVASAQCFIDATCYADGSVDPVSSCRVCDSARAVSGWSAATGRCAIGRSCYADKQTIAGGCLACDVSTSSTRWSPGSANVDLRSFDFEDGKLPAGWTAMNSHMDVGWQVLEDGQRAAGGRWSLYYGDPARKSYDNGLINSGSVTSEAFVVKAGVSAGLRFWAYFDTETSPFRDLLDVEVAPILGPGGRIWRRSPATPQKSWHQVALSLANWTGRTVRIVFRFRTLSTQDNSGLGVFIDDVTLFSGCQ